MKISIEARGKGRGAVVLEQAIFCLGLIGAGLAGLVARAEPLLNWYYPLVWWGVIGVVDSLTLYISGSSPLRRDPKGFLILASVSVPFWLFFEAYNLFLKNWYYVFATSRTWERWILYSVSFATVLPAVFEVKALLEALGAFRGWATKKRELPRAMPSVMASLGAISMILPLVAPSIFFPLVWLGLLMVLDAYNYRSGGSSLLRQWEMGQLQELMTLLASGLICGVLWEGLNFPASTKWIYTVPHFEGMKVFEMPLPGYLGFPAFALECHAFWASLEVFRSKERPASLKGWRTAWPIRCCLAVVTIIGCIWTFHLVDTRTISSFHPTVEGLASLAPLEASCLSQNGIHRLDFWLGETASRVLGDCMPKEAIERWRRWAQLASLRGIGTENALLLHTVGIDDIEDLGKSTPHSLWKRIKGLSHSGKSKTRLPREAQVRVWVKAAKDLVEEAKKST